MQSHSNVYAAHKEKQQELSRMLIEAAEAIELLSLDSDIKDLLSMAETVSNASFKVLVVGTFKNGKSTFINSFLGKEVLPAFARPCTAVINEIVYHHEPKAVLHFKPPQPDKQLPKGIPEQTLRHIQRYRSGEIPPIEIPSDEIEKYVVIPMDKDPKEMLLESPYEKLVLSWPLELLENGVEIIDSPGLNEHATRTAVTEGYLRKADAILFVLTADKLCAETEMNFIENHLHRRNVTDVYYIINRFDLLRQDRDKNEVVQLAKTKLRDFTRFGEEGLFFVSAFNALDGKIKDDENLYKDSGMPEFEKTLGEFLTNERGRAKLSTPSRELRRILEDVINKTIPQKRGMLDSDLEILIKKRDEALPILESAMRRRSSTEQNIRKQIERIEPEIRDKTRFFFQTLKDRLAEWVWSYPPSTNCETEGEAKQMVQEIIDLASENIQIEEGDFQDKTILPILINKIEDIIHANEDNFQSIRRDLDAIRADVSGVKTSESDSVKHETYTLKERIFAASDFSSVTELGSNENFVTKSLRFIVDGLEGAWLNNFWSIPIRIIGELCRDILLDINRASKKEQMISGIKQKVIQGIEDVLNKRATDAVEATVNRVSNELWLRFCPELERMAADVREVEEQVNRAIAEKEQGQAEVDKGKARLVTSETTATGLLAKIERFIVTNRLGGK